MLIGKQNICIDTVTRNRLYFPEHALANSIACLEHMIRCGILYAICIILSHDTEIIVFLI